jgi:predicted transcriptional regulator
MADHVPTGRELEALKVLWARGGATVREVHEALARDDGAGELAYTTILSLLQTMEQKGLVSHEADGKAYRYHPRVKSQTVLTRLAGGFLERVFDGALGEYVARALESRAPSLAELEDLERRIADAKRGLNTRRPQRSKP